MTNDARGRRRGGGDGGIGRTRGVALHRAPKRGRPRSDDGSSGPLACRRAGSSAGRAGCARTKSRRTRHSKRPSGAITRMPPPLTRASTSSSLESTFTRNETRSSRIRSSAARRSSASTSAARQLRSKALEGGFIAVYEEPRGEVRAASSCASSSSAVSSATRRTSSAA